MKKIFIFVTLAMVVLSISMGYLFRPVVEEYGVTTVQYDEQAGTYFAEVTSRYEVKPTAEIKVGMPVSYYKTDGTVLRVSSTLESEEDVQARAISHMWLGLGTGVSVGWLVFVFILWCEYRRRKQLEARIAENGKND